MTSVLEAEGMATVSAAVERGSTCESSSHVVYLNVHSLKILSIKLVLVLIFFFFY